MSNLNNRNRLRHDLMPGLLELKHGADKILKGLQKVETAVEAFEPGAVKSQSLIVSPTGGPLRGNDNHGMGHFGAPRGSQTHKGGDYVGEPGQNVVAPIDGKVIRVARPYADDSRFSGLLISGQHLYIKIFYIEPDLSLIGEWVFKGKTVIGTMQDIGKRYAGIPPHVHLQAMVDPEYLRK